MEVEDAMNMACLIVLFLNLRLASWKLITIHVFANCDYLDAKNCVSWAFKLESPVFWYRTGPSQIAQLNLEPAPIPL